MRLDRYVSQAGGYTRSEARALIRGGRVTVDGTTVSDTAFTVDEQAEVQCESHLLQLSGALYLMMNKPCGLLSATRDSHQPTVLSLLPDPIARRVHLVGRLDKDSSGLLLLSDDGAWSHQISSPRKKCAKVYVADLAEELVEFAEQHFCDGIQLHGEPRLTRPAGLQRLGPRRVRVTLEEGRYHQVRRMFAALGNRVTTLHRERIGGLTLDPGLAPGAWRELGPGEHLTVFR